MVVITDRTLSLEIADRQLHLNNVFEQRLWGLQGPAGACPGSQEVRGGVNLA